MQATMLTPIPRGGSELEWEDDIGAGGRALRPGPTLDDGKRLYALFDAAMSCEEGQRLFLALEQECERCGTVVGRIIGVSFGLVKTDDPIPALEGGERSFEDPERNDECAARMRIELARAFRSRRWQEELARQLWTVKDVISLLEDAVRLVPVATGECA